MQLNDQRKAFLVERLALKDELSKIRQEYEKIFDDKIWGEDLIKFRDANRLLIENFAKKELNNVKKEPLAHARVRLRMLNDALTYAMTPRATRSVPVHSSGKDVDYQVTYEPDYAAVARLVSAAQNEEFFIKKMFLDIKKMQISQDELGGNGDSGFDIIPVDNGIRLIEGS